MTPFQRWTLYIAASAAILSLAGVIATIVVGTKSIDRQREELAAQRELLDQNQRQFEKSGAVIEVDEPEIVLRNKQSKEMAVVPSPSRIGFQELFSSDIYLRFSVINTGRSAGKVAEVG